MHTGQDLYVAVTKATLGEEVVPKEKHVRSECACPPLLRPPPIWARTAA